MKQMYLLMYHLEMKDEGAIDVFWQQTGDAYLKGTILLLLLLSRFSSV